MTKRKRNNSMVFPRCHPLPCRKKDPCPPQLFHVVHLRMRRKLPGHAATTATTTATVAANAATCIAAATAAAAATIAVAAAAAASAADATATDTSSNCSFNCRSLVSVRSISRHAKLFRCSLKSVMPSKWNTELQNVHQAPSSSMTNSMAKQLKMTSSTVPHRRIMLTESMQILYSTRPFTIVATNDGKMYKQFGPIHSPACANFCLRLNTAADSAHSTHVMGFAKRSRRSNESLRTLKFVT
mmetsp:Transcript_126897/g.406343  ORF Transcript_126897/g.406343 Transcript_126897/m.406343 type:complete len:242 (-) Transcript_126897:508-1233(-)